MLQIIQGGSDKSGIFFFLLSNDTAQLKIIQFSIEVKTNLHRYISRIILCIKTAVSINNSPDPGPQALAGLHHGVPVEGP